MTEQESCSYLQYQVLLVNLWGVQQSPRGGEVVLGERVGVQVDVDGQGIDDRLSRLFLCGQRAGKDLQRLKSARQQLVLGFGTEVQNGCTLLVSKL